MTLEVHRCFRGSDRIAHGQNEFGIRPHALQVQVHEVRKEPDMKGLARMPNAEFCQITDDPACRYRFLPLSIDAPSLPRKFTSIYVFLFVS